jgi:hyperosmotically inducible protein
MALRNLMLAVATATALTVTAGCAITRDQSTVGEYIDDTAITTAVKARLVENKSVDAAAISVETLNGTVQLSGFAKTAAEKAQAETIARGAKNVKSVRNNIIVKAS